MSTPNNESSFPEKKFSAEELDRIMAETVSSDDAKDPQSTSNPNTANLQNASGANQPTGSAAGRSSSAQRGSSPTASQISSDPTGKDPRGKHTSLQCLALVARHHGIDVSADRLIHDYSLEHDEPSLRRVLRIGKDTGLKIRHTRMTWKQLQKLEQAFPAMIRLQNGNYVIAVGLRKGELEDGTSVEQVAVFDPLADQQGFIFLTQEEFERSWKGEIILAKRKYSVMDTNQPFSLRWFLPEVLRQRTAFMDVAVAALFIHLIALVVPLFFQIVIDKVLVNYAKETLQVLTVGIIIALMFDAVLGYLRSYLLLHATSKIDIRVATRTFGHLMKLPMNFFEQITAGVLTKHMQQTSQIREFLTGSLFLTMLDATALVVFIPILYYYSAQLTIVVLIFSALLGVNIAVLLVPYRKRLEALYHAEGERQAMLVETIHGIQTVKALSMEPVQRNHWDQSSAQAVAMHFRVGKISIAATTISKFLEKLLTVTVVWYGASLVLGKTLSVGELVAFQMISGRVTGPLVQLVSLLPTVCSFGSHAGNRHEPLRRTWCRSRSASNHRRRDAV
jgi:ATP-binding cassette subfamily B protein